VWHRNNVLLLLSLLLLVAVFALKLTAGRPWLPYALPLAAVGMIVTVLLDAGAAMVMTALIALLAAAVSSAAGTTAGVELAAYVLLGGIAGIVTVRRGERLAVFVQAGLAVFIVNVLVVVTFGLFGDHDIYGVLQLIGAAGVAAGGAAVATVGSFAVLGSLFGILPAFQLLELANPSQALLRRLLVETPGTYHHSLMVGNLAERAAEAIGADPLLARVAAYYHDIGKLSNPVAFIENQAGGENIHDDLDPETSAQLLKSHVSAGIDIAYKSGLPKALIAFIPQHHGTAVMSYFYARAKEQAAAPFGGVDTVEGRKAAEAVDIRKFRHGGPKPQVREAAIIMLADSVEASVRSLSARDEPAIRAMVSRIIEERIADDQFDECDLTLRDIEMIREAFVAQLLGMYHQRVAYPQNKVVELESRRAVGDK
jgi:cyclic-di-AMP phosphodiesterase PgpH